jgi:hypothetical protein
VIALNRKLLLAIIISIIAVLLIIGLWFYSISLVFGVIVSIVTTFGFLLDHLLKHFTKPKVDLQIENAEFMAKGFDHNYIGYQLKALVTNKGKKNRSGFG